MNREYRLLKKLKKGTLSEQEFDDEVSEDLGDGEASAPKASSSTVQSNGKSHSKVKNRSAPRASKKRSS